MRQLVALSRVGSAAQGTKSSHVGLLSTAEADQLSDLQFAYQVSVVLQQFLYVKLFLKIWVSP